MVPKATIVFSLAMGLAPSVSADNPDLPPQMVAEERVCDFIGTAMMKDDGTIVLDLRCPAMALFEYKIDDPRYRYILDHIGPLRPGQQVVVPPFPEAKQ